MSDASTSEHLSPATSEGSGTSSPLGHVAASPISGRAGWWQSPCPDLVGALAGQPAEATRPQAHLIPAHSGLFQPKFEF